MAKPLDPKKITSSKQEHMKRDEDGANIIRGQ